MSDIRKTMEAYLEMVSEKSCGKDRMKEEKEECPKCEGEGCDHCDGKGYHEVSEKTVNSVAKSAPSKDAKSYSEPPKSAQASTGKDAGKTGVAAQGGKKEELDPVNDKENDKKFKDRKDKDIDNDGDVDSSDEYLHKKRAATDDAIDGGDKPADNADDKDDKKKKKTSGNNGEKTAEISKIGEKVTTKEEFDALWSMFEAAVQKKGVEAEKMDDKMSPKSKEFVAKHTIDKKDHDDMEKIEEPKKREVKKEDVSEYEVIRRILSGQVED